MKQHIGYINYQRFAASKISLIIIIKLIKCDSKDMYNVTEDFYLKSMLFFKLSINSRILKKVNSVFPQKI